MLFDFVITYIAQFIVNLGYSAVFPQSYCFDYTLHGTCNCKPKKIKKKPYTWHQYHLTRAALKKNQIDKDTALTVLENLLFCQNGKYFDNSTLNCFYAYTLSLKTVYEKAEMFYLRSIYFSNYQNANAYHNYGLLLHNLLQRYDDAAIQYKKAIELRPNTAKPYLNYADVLCKLNRFQDAITVYQNYQLFVQNDENKVQNAKKLELFAKAQLLRNEKLANGSNSQLKLNNERHNKQNHQLQNQDQQDMIMYPKLSKPIPKRQRKFLRNKHNSMYEVSDNQQSNLLKRRLSCEPSQGSRVRYNSWTKNDDDKQNNVIISDFQMFWESVQIPQQWKDKYYAKLMELGLNNMSVLVNGAVTLKTLETDLRMMSVHANYIFSLIQRWKQYNKDFQSWLQDIGMFDEYYEIFERNEVSTFQTFYKSFLTESQLSKFLTKKLSKNDDLHLQDFRYIWQSTPKIQRSSNEKVSRKNKFNHALLKISAPRVSPRNKEGMYLQSERSRTASTSQEREGKRSSKSKIKGDTFQ